MKNRKFLSIRIKLMISIFLGIIFASAMMGVFFAAAKSLYNIPFFHEILSLLSDHLGIQATGYLVWMLFFIVFIYIITHRSFSYLKEIVDAVKTMEKSSLDIKVDIRTDDELGNLASALNRMAEKLKKSIEEERKAEATKKELITSVSHDLRTPLTSVIGFLGLLNHRGSHKEEELERFSGIAYKKALKLQELIDELFEYTRVSYSGIKVNASKINIVELLEQLAEEFYPILEENGMICRLTHNERKVYIYGDGDLTARLIENLLNNAIRYGKSGRYIDLSVEEKNRHVHIQVVNYGESISKEVLPYIFERFYRGEISRSRETGGTGLGLAIAKNIVELHGGSITASSSYESTCFEVKFPVYREEFNL